MTRLPTQPDLFGEADAAEERARRWRQPATCPRCGQEEPNGFLLRQNHGIEPGTDTICGFKRGEHPNYGELCTAQYLVTNHIVSDVRRGDDEALIRDAARGRQLGLDVDGIVIAEARNQ